ncbi:MAG TPA: serine hydrolase [Trebonia sp.]|nr:serine hydrolase [Trebonia sp.]
MVSTGRAVAGAAVAVAAALVLVIGLFVVLRGHGADPAADASGVRGAVGSGGPSGSAAAQAAMAPQGSSPGSPAANPLSGAAAAWVAGRAGTVRAAVYDVATGQSWRLGDGPVQAEASVVKLDILETLLARGGVSGLSAADKSLARSMIEDSDNDAATSLWDKAGGAGGLAAYNDEAGLTRTTPSSCVTCSGFPWPGWGLTTTVPYDQLVLLRQLVVPGEQPLLSHAARSYALSLLEHVAPGQRWGVSAGVPAGVTVALKNGWLPLDGVNSNWQVNSVGWVSGGGRDYLIAVFSTGTATEKYGIETISHLSKLVWSALG